MLILEKLSTIWEETDDPFLIHNGHELRFSGITAQNPVDLSLVRPGDVVAIIGDFNPSSILTLLRLIDLQVIVVPLTVDTASEHEYFFESALVDVVIRNGVAARRSHGGTNELIKTLRAANHAGLVLF